jgi:hypothetical protein
VLRLEPGELDAAQTEALSNLLRTELVELGLELRLEHTTENEARWFAQQEPGSALLFASVDVSAQQGWRVFLFDSEERTSVRELGGTGDNAAMVEAVAAVLVSAASALSQSEQQTAPPEAAVVPESEPEPRPAPSVAPEPPASSEFTPLHLPRAWRLHLAVGVGGSSFERNEPVTLGPTLELGVLHERFALDLCATRSLELSYQTDFGDFSLTRSALSLRAGPLFQHGDWLFVTALVTGVELIERERGVPSSVGIAAEGSDSARWSFGPAALVRYGASESLLLEAGLWGAYFPEPLRFTADEGRQVLAAPFSFAAGAFAGLGVRL